MQNAWIVAAAAGALLLAGCTNGRKTEGQHAPMAKIQPAPAAEANAPAATLKVGDAAPALSVEKWMRGAPVNGFEKGKVHVVEFWATWCPPCVASIPHLTTLQAEHPEVVVIGVAGSERQPAQGQADSREETLARFITKQGDKMGYRVAFDSDRSMANTWMKPAGRGGIPCAFIVGRDGKIAWIGHPTQMDKELQSAIAAK